MAGTENAALSKRVDDKPRSSVPQIVDTMQRAWNMASNGSGRFEEHPQAMRSRQRNLRPSRSQPLITEAARRLQARGHLMESPYHSPDKMPQLQGRRASLGSPGRAGKGRQLQSAQSAGTKHTLLAWNLSGGVLSTCKHRMQQPPLPMLVLHCACWTLQAVYTDWQ